MEILTGEIDLCVNGEASYGDLFYDVYDEFEAYADRKSTRLNSSHMRLKLMREDIYLVQIILN